MALSVKKILRRLPFLFKALFLTVSSAIIVGMAADYYVNRMISSVFEKHLHNMLLLQSQENRLRFDHYIENFYHRWKDTLLKNL